MDATRAALVVALVLIAGCTAGTPTDTASPAGPTSTTSPTQTNTPTAQCVDDVSFWGLAGGDMWAPDTVRIGYTLPPSSNALFVVYENDTVLGSSYASNDDPEHAIASDGDAIELETALQGNHTIRVVVYRDANGNGTFDAAVDEQCSNDGAVVQAGPRTVNFDRFGTNGTETT